MKIRALFVSFMLVVAMLMASVTAAQDMCFGLSAEDCQAIGEASTSTLVSMMSPFNAEFSFDLSVTGAPGGDITLNVKGRGPIVMSMSGDADIPLSFQQTLDIAYSGPDGSQSVQVEVRLVDGILYVNDPTSGWVGMDLAAAMENPAALGLPINPAQLAGAADPTAMGLNEQTLGQLMALVMVPGFLSHTRDGDTFTFKADVGALLKSEEFATASTAITQALADDPNAAQGAMMLSILPMILSDGVVTVVQVVDPALNAVTDLTFAVDATINAGAMAGDSSTPPIVLHLALNLKILEMGGNYEIVAPEGATMMPMGGQ